MGNCSHFHRWREIDHIIPLAEGGTEDPENTQGCAQIVIKRRRRPSRSGQEGRASQKSRAYALGTCA
ncbi:HNH endonuclease [Nitrosospira multiformis]|uniref:HNH endonuclease n=1 Tax=Nitrosospira multiformis TaxID=1231 RepID=UPI0015A59385